MLMMITKKRIPDDEGRETLILAIQIQKLKNLVYYVKLLNIFIIMEIKNENTFFFENNYSIVE